MQLGDVLRGQQSSCASAESMQLVNFSSLNGLGKNPTAPDSSAWPRVLSSAKAVMKMTGISPALLLQPLVQFDSAEARHLNISDQAVRAVRVRIQKFFSRRERV